MGQVELSGAAEADGSPCAEEADEDALRALLGVRPRSGKPRAVGLTHVLDGGLSCAQLRETLASAGRYVDFVKLGWGTAAVTHELREKVALCRRHDVRIGLGGTTLELAAARGQVDALTAWMRSAGVDYVEVSDGLGRLGPAKCDIIRRLVPDFTVLAEVGLKSPASVVDPEVWAEQAQLDLEAGAAYVIVEGRESGTVGAFCPDGSVRVELIDALVRHVPASQLIFEAPQTRQQAWFVRRFGPEANIGNVPPCAVVSLETLRLGLRADTAELLPRDDDVGVAAA
jgi:phosphosulfolactate synthase